MYNSSIYRHKHKNITKSFTQYYLLNSFISGRFSLGYSYFTVHTNTVCQRIDLCRSPKDSWWIDHWNLLFLLQSGVRNVFWLLHCRYMDMLSSSSFITNWLTLASEPRQQKSTGNAVVDRNRKRIPLNTDTTQQEMQHKKSWTLLPARDFLL